MKTFVRLAVLCIIITVAHRTANASVLIARLQVDLSGFGPGGASSGVGGDFPLAEFDFVVADPHIGHEDTTGEWIVGPLTEMDAGRVFMVTPDDSGDSYLSEFLTIAGLLTNGQDDDVFFGVGKFPPPGGGSIGASESLVFSGSDPFTGSGASLDVDLFVPSKNGIDLSGYQIDQMSLRVDFVNIDFIDGTTWYRGGYTVELFGSEVPEPASLVVWAVILCAVIRKHRGRRRTCQAS